jgi:hypothetical protein
MKKVYLAALATFILIPLVILSSTLIFAAINPEAAIHHADYERNYRLLEWLRQAILFAGALAGLALWLATCFLLLTSKQRSLAWLTAAALGPLGFAALAMLDDHAPAPDDTHQAFRTRLAPWQRAAYESLLFIGLWASAYALVELKAECAALFEAGQRGVPLALILQEHEASSGMMAFSEGLETMYLVVLLYLLWPIAVNTVNHLWQSARRHFRS